MEDANTTPPQPPSPQYRWPWMVLAAAILSVILAILWMSLEVDRMRRIRDLNTPEAATNTHNTPAARN